MSRVASFVAAASGSGKTTLIEKVVRILKSRGMRVAVVKHASKGFELDRPGKDSWRFQEAGADSVALIGPDRMALMKKIGANISHADIESLVADADVIIKEGFKKDTSNKIEVFRSEVSGDTPLCMNDASFIALVSDISFDVPIPRFDINDAEGVAEFIVTRMKVN